MMWSVFGFPWNTPYFANPTQWTDALCAIQIYLSLFHSGILQCFPVTAGTSPLFLHPNVFYFNMSEVLSSVFIFTTQSHFPKNFRSLFVLSCMMLFLNTHQPIQELSFQKSPCYTLDTCFEVKKSSVFHRLDHTMPCHHGVPFHLSTSLLPITPCQETCFGSHVVSSLLCITCCWDYFVLYDYC